MINHLRESLNGTKLGMRIIALKTVKAFWAEHPDAEQPLKIWCENVRKAAWQTPADIKACWRSASILKNSRVVFNIKGNHYRIVTAIAFRRGIVFVKFIGTHRQYDAIEAETVSLEDYA